MLTSELISNQIPALKHTDTIDLAMHWMEEFKVNHLAVIKGKELLGLVSEQDLHDTHVEPETEIAASKVHLIRPIIHSSQHAYDAMKLMYGMNLSVLPVLDEKEQYLGSVTQKVILDKMSSLSAVTEPGGIIELEMHKNDYSLTQIASIIEGNDAKVLSFYISSIPDSMKIEIIIKINVEDLSRIIQTFNRYNYTVKASYHQQEFEEDLKSKFNEFMRFINI